MTVAIVGAGLIGTSVALAVRRRDADARIVTLDRGESLDGLAGADLVVLATPVDVIIDLLRSASDRFRHSIVTDVGSTKRAIVAAARAAGLTHFVGGHPMAGAATTGPGDSRADLFDGRPWFLVSNGAAAEAHRHVREFVTTLGSRVVEFDDDGAEHDRVMAAISHLPQVAATALMTVIGESVGADGLQWAGPGCRDTTRLAASPSSVWHAILRTNEAEIRPLLLALADEIRSVADQLSDRAAIDRLFTAANRHREEMK